MPKALMFAGSCNGALPYVRNPKGVGISAFRVDLGTGAAEHLADETDVLNPTFVAMSADGRSLLASSELAGAAEGMLSAYAVDPASGCCVRRASRQRPRSLSMWRLQVRRPSSSRQAAHP